MKLFSRKGMYHTFLNLIRALSTVLKGQEIRYGLDSQSRAGFWKNDVPLIIQQPLSKSFGNFWYIVIVRRHASPIRRINLMAHPLLALKRLRGMFKDLAFFIASSRNRL
jgi:hypothetical protein